MHSPWHMVGDRESGDLKCPTMEVDGKLLYTVEFGVAPITTIVRAQPPGYTVTYKTGYNNTPTEPAHIDDGIRVDSGVATVVTAWSGNRQRIVARTFDWTGAKAPSIASHGSYRFYGQILTFIPPDDSVLAPTSFPFHIHMYAPEGWLIRYNAGGQFAPPQDLGNKPFGEWVGSGIGHAVFTFYRHTFPPAGNWWQILARVWADGGNGPMHPDPFLAEYVW